MACTLRTGEHGGRGGREYGDAEGHVEGDEFGHGAGRLGSAVPGALGSSAVPAVKNNTPHTIRTALRPVIMRRHRLQAARGSSSRPERHRGCAPRSFGRRP